MIKKHLIFPASLLLSMLFFAACNLESSAEESDGIPIILDTDTNNELDDQHAIAYLLLSGEALNTVGITVNATFSGGEIDLHMEEAERVVKLCGFKGKVPLVAGANGSFGEIRKHLNEKEYDGHKAVDFIVKEAMKKRKQKLVLLPVGKLTNIALALEKEPRIATKVKVVWLGGNYPAPGEYNLDNDTAALNYILNTNVPFEMVTVRYGETTGTTAVKVRRKTIYLRMPGMGPRVEEPVEGRHGSSFHCFGDYSVDLFRHIKELEGGCFRSLYDMAAVAIVKNQQWADSREIPCPLYQEGSWVERPYNKRKIIIRENFHTEAILEDFFSTLEAAQ